MHCYVSKEIREVNNHSFLALIENKYITVKLLRISNEIFARSSHAN